MGEQIYHQLKHSTGEQVHYITVSKYVTDPPLWNRPTMFASAGIDDTSVTLQCDVCANPAPHSYTWTYANGTELRPGVMQNIQDGTLVIDKVGSSDFTEYACSATNTIGDQDHIMKYNITLIERGRSKF